MTSAPDDPKFVITGFGPFADHATNPSWDVARAMGQAFETSAHLLAVQFGTAAQFATAHLRANPHQPLLFIHCGLAAERTYLSLERRAVNSRNDTPDEHERQFRPDLPPTQPLRPQDRDHRFSRLDFSALQNRYRQGRTTQDLPNAQISQDCGRYVCNALFYHSLYACQQARAQGQFADAIFLHIPPLDSERAAELGHYLATQVFSPPPRLR